MKSRIFMYLFIFSVLLIIFQYVNSKNIIDKYEKDSYRVSLTVPQRVTSLADLGIQSSIDFIVYVTPGGIAEKIGLMRGDRLVSLDGEEYGIGQIYTAINRDPNNRRTLVWNRNGTTYSAPFKPAFIPAGEAGDLGLKQDRYDSGFKAQKGIEF